MGKKFFVILIVTIVMTSMGYNVNQSQNTVKLSDLALSNVEALAESPEDYTDRTGCVAVTENVSCTDYDGKSHSYSKDDDKE